MRVVIFRQKGLVSERICSFAESAPKLGTVETPLFCFVSDKKYTQVDKVTRSLSFRCLNQNPERVFCRLLLCTRCNSDVVSSSGAALAPHSIPLGLRHCALR